MLALLAASVLGSAHFAATGPPECRKKVLEGVLLLHSFMYEDAREAFQAAAKSAPCPIAYWGEAMTYDHPIWNEQDGDKGRAALAKIPAGAKVSPMEQGLIEAARALYGNGREAWMERLSLLHAQLPGDDEVSLFYALSLYASSNGGRDVKRAMQAAAIAMDVFERNPDHPGAAHYLIHACDSPDHAILALKAARKYAQIAPGASHALHMPSHIFVQLGMWKDAADSNAAAFAASKQPKDWHSFSWLAAANIQLGHPERVLPMLGAEGLPQSTRAVLVVAFVEETRAWGRIDELLGADDTPAAIRLRLDAAGVRGDEGEAVRLAASLEAATTKMHGESPKLAAAARVAQAKSLRDTGSIAAAIDAMRKLADAEDASVSGPAFFTPAREELGDLFLRSHRFVEAEREFRAALLVRPNRLNALRGLAEAARGADDPRTADDAQARLAAQVR
ncbi:MAG TPA: hypothetical protein VLW85_21050 [Myxococcales bacterium]|nr:hypothetical protein [Myxococcales bacterium]